MTRTPLLTFLAEPDMADEGQSPSSSMASELGARRPSQASSQLPGDGSRDPRGNTSRISRSILSAAVQRVMESDEDELIEAFKKLYAVQPEMASALMDRAFPGMAARESAPLYGVLNIVYFAMTHRDVGCKSLDEEQVRRCFNRASARVDAWRRVDGSTRIQLVELTIQCAAEPALASFLLGVLEAPLHAGLRSRANRAFALAVLWLLECVMAALDVNAGSSFELTRAIGHRAPSGAMSSSTRSGVARVRAD